ncbi:MAG: farnesyl diphosphate synthase [Tahibacter sp.]
MTAELLEYSARSESTLAQMIPPADQAPVELHGAMRYAVLGGGKRLRPMLAYATGRALGATLDQLDAVAASVEIIHAYSLVHDDLPAMDDDALRRGKPTCHIVYGEAMAILAGDALQALAFELLAGDTTARIDSNVRVEMLRVLGAACGSHGMAGGQALDLAAVGKTLLPAELERMHVHKTGALIRASVLLGAMAAGCRDTVQLDAFREYGHCIGLAFQIRDDILDIEGNSSTIGKTAGKDAANDKPTYPAILGIDRSRALLAELTERALLHLEFLGAAGEELRTLGRFVAIRTS